MKINPNDPWGTMICPAGEDPAGWLFEAIDGHLGPVAAAEWERLAFDAREPAGLPSVWRFYPRATIPFVCTGRDATWHAMEWFEESWRYVLPIHVRPVPSSRRSPYSDDLEEIAITVTERLGHRVTDELMCMDPQSGGPDQTLATIASKSWRFYPETPPTIYTGGRSAKTAWTFEAATGRWTPETSPDPVTQGQSGCWVHPVINTDCQACIAWMSDWPPTDPQIGQP